ncbi:MAG TPA: ABC transporter ATP-binding protein [Bacteroidales bacterium]|nr:ABC transporter ATP-binding protein [Bacteroidales bacterium]
MLRLTDINKRLGEFSLSGISLDIPEGQYYVLLGRSGSGKTRLLELIAGLDKPDSGSIILDEKDITRTRIQERRIGIVFQDFAIFPHLTVSGNIAYPLRSRRIPEKEIEKQVNEVATRMNISHLLHRKAEKLSGGEQQRIALARTLVISPRLLLLDEPLSSLDASLCDEMKSLLRDLKRRGQTIIHVTHDYSEAITLADRVGVIHNGRIIQEGIVDDVFNKPANRFVARYAGMKNFFRIDVTRHENVVRGVTSNGIPMKIPQGNYNGNYIAVMKSRDISVSTERPSADSQNIYKGKVTEISRSESGMEMVISAGDIFHAEMTMQEFLHARVCENDEVWLSFSPGSLIILDSGHTE